MQALLKQALDTATAAGASYADVRWMDRQSQSLVMRNGDVETISETHSLGFGVRVLCNGAWGFASSADFSPAEIDRIAAQAVAIAKASATVRTRPVTLAPVAPVQATYVTPFRIDPFAVPLAEKLALLEAADKALRGEATVKVAHSLLICHKTHKIFASSDGAWIDQTIVECGGGVSATAVGADEVQVRSYPSSHGGNLATAGWEYVEALNLVAEAPRVAAEAAALLTAPTVPPGEQTVILGSSQLALQIHESIGHPTELDRVLGTELSFAGGSFLTPGALGELRYGSDLVNVVADATCALGLGTFGYDDEGVPAQRSHLIENGLFTGFLTSRETAATLDQPSNGTMRAQSWGDLPLIRMTNINLLPGAWTLDGLIADTADGIFMDTNRSWSIDDRRLNFQFACEAAWEIKDGVKGRLLKNPLYMGITPQFWGSCDAIADAAAWQIWGVPNCGKGEPMQSMHVGHGTSPARFKRVNVGVAR
ncbi:MAG: TldD/PmbA family protein [Candidatus Sericytochromatia bacterium]|nr:TldD/PmbA family protein [Candidatus Sericytochromatia bacterium]